MGKIDWEVVTNYVDVVTTTLKTVTFPKVQEKVYLRNQGNANVTYTIGSQSGTLTPGQSVTVQEDISSFTLQAVSGTHTFELRANEKGTEINETDSSLPSNVADQLSSLTSQLADMATLVNITDTSSVIASKLTSATNSIKFPNGEYVIKGSALASKLISITKPIKIFGENSVIYLESGAQLELKNPNIEIYGIQFKVRNIGTLTGGESCVLIRRNNIKIDNCYFGGTSYYHGIFIGNSEGINCDDVKITNCEFDTLGYGILKQGANNVTSHRLYIHKNKFRNIQKGDAIEVNIGGDKGITVTYNDIDNVNSGGIVNAGLGIGLAGGGSYGVWDGTEISSFTVANNTVRNFENQGIHIEKGSDGVIKDNIVDNIARTSTTYGIVTYGTRNTIIDNNYVVNTQIGILDDLGINNGNFAISTDNNKINNNYIENSSKRAIDIGVTGELKSVYVTLNTIKNSTIGISLYGKATIYIEENKIIDCATPMSLDYEGSAKSTLFPSRYRFIAIKNNSVITKGIRADNGKCYANIVNYDLVQCEGNNFKLGNFTTRKPSVFIKDVNEPLYYVKGDILVTINGDNTTKQQIALNNGYRIFSDTIAYYRATAGTSYITIASGSAEARFRIGQLVNLRGLGTSGSDLITMIEYFYVQNSEYRVKISDTIVTSTSSDTGLPLSETVSFSA